MPESEKEDAAVEERNQIKVDKWDGGAIKNALDDTAKAIILEKYGVEEDHTLIDVRLSVAFIACSFAGFACLWDYLYPFPESRFVLITCALTYFVLMFILTLYITFIEKGIFFRGLEKDPAGVDASNVWTLSSNMKRFDDEYTLQLQYMEGGSSGAERSASVTKSVAAYFDDAGVLREEIFEPDVVKMRDSLCKAKKTK